MKVALALTVAALGVTPALAQDAPVDTAAVEAGIAEIDRLREAGKFGEARRAFNALQPTAQKAPEALQVRFSVAVIRTRLEASHRYAAGRDAGYFGADELVKSRMAGFYPSEIGVTMARELFAMLARMRNDRPLRAALLAAPHLAPLHEAPDFRVARWVAWREPRVAIWPDQSLATDDPVCDELFAELGAEPPSPPEEEDPRVVRYMDTRGPQRPLRPADLWVFFLRCSYLSPIKQGGWPTRISLLRKPDAVASAIADIEARVETMPPAFHTACLVNLAVQTDDLERAASLLATLR
jgi:hypothetical protein